MLVKANDADKILSGDDEEFRRPVAPLRAKRKGPAGTGRYLRFAPFATKHRAVRPDANTRCSESRNPFGTLFRHVAAAVGMKCHHARSVRRRLTAPHSFVGAGPAAAQLASVADRPEVLVPIRLDLEAAGYRLRDVFMWNLNGAHPAPGVHADTGATLV